MVAQAAEEPTREYRCVRCHATIKSGLLRPRECSESAGGCGRKSYGAGELTEFWPVGETASIGEPMESRVWWTRWDEVAAGIGSAARSRHLFEHEYPPTLTEYRECALCQFERTPKKVVKSVE